MASMLLKMNVLPLLIQLKTTDVLFVWVSEWHIDEKIETQKLFVSDYEYLGSCVTVQKTTSINMHQGKDKIKKKGEYVKMCPLLRGKVCLVFSFKLCGDFLRRRRISHTLHNHLRATSKGPYLCTLSNHIWWQIASSLCCVTKTNTGKS